MMEDLIGYTIEVSDGVSSSEQSSCKNCLTQGRLFQLVTVDDGTQEITITKVFKEDLPDLASSGGFVCDECHREWH